MTRFSFGWFHVLAMLVIATLLGACGGGAVGAPPSNGDPAKVSILPDTATLYSGMPTVFVISGGNGSYVVTSSNQNVVPLAGPISGHTLTVSANSVGADTPVTLTVRDTATATPATASLTVRPGTVSNEVTITPSPTQGLNCAPAICSGGDALVTATLSQAGVPLSGRSVRLEAISGDFRFVTSPAGSTIEILDTAITLPTDASGHVTARLRALPAAANQTAVLQVTDLATGSFQRASFVIAQATGTSPGFFASPSSVQFQGRLQGQCAGTDISATFYVFGGTPPYVVSNSISTLIVRPEVVTSNGGSFTVTPSGACIGAPGVPITIRDAAGRTTTVNVANISGTQTLPTLVASPSNVNISSCNATASVQIAGGTGGPYFVASGSDALIATVAGSTVTIARRNPSGASGATANVGISDGTSVVNVTVTLSGAALAACPATQFAASPTSVTLTDCTSAGQVTLSGGSGTYTAVPSSSAITAKISGGLLSIARASPSSSFSSGTVTVSDGQTSKTITVSATGAGAGACGAGTAGIDLNPSSVTLTDCRSSVSSLISGGSGTYNAVASSSQIAATVTGSTLSVRRVNPSGAFSGGTVTVTDGSSTASLFVDAIGEASDVCPSPVAASPSNVTLNDCTTAAIVTISGGSGSYTATPNTTALTVSQNSTGGNVLSIRRTNPSGAFSGGTVTVSDGSTSATINVNATGAAANACPTPGAAFSASPNIVTLTDCTTPVQVTLSGGSGNYTATSQSPSVLASVSGNILSIRRGVPSAPLTASTTVQASDGTSTITISVNGTGTGAGSCPDSSSTAVSANPSSVTLSSCSSSPSVVLSGGTGSYAAAASNTGILLTQNSNILTISRKPGSPAITSGNDCQGQPTGPGQQCVTVSSGTAASTTISVTLSGPALLACP